MSDIDAAPVAAPATIGTRLTRIFVGTEGLRAGWSILLFLLLVALGSWLCNHFLPLGRPVPQAGMAPGRTIRGETMQCVVLLGAAFLLSRLERRPFADYGFRASRPLATLAIGFGWGFAAMSALIGMLLASGTLVYDGLALGAGAALGYGAAWLLAFLLVGLLEEFLFRGYLQFTLARGVAGIARWISPGNRHAATIGFWAAAAVFSVLLFALAHTGNGGETLLGLVSVSLAGLVFVFSLWRTGSLWWAIGFHASWDWAQTYLYGVRDSGLPAQGHLLVTHPAGNVLVSGGTTGPEGSILIVPTLLVVCYVIHRTLPRRGAAPA